MNCDLLLIVCDATDDYAMQLDTTLKTLDELHCEVPHLTVMNKSESLASFDGFPRDSIFISAKRGVGLEGLKSKIAEFFSENLSRIRLRIPYLNIGEYEKLKRFATERSIFYSGDAVEIEADVENRFLHKFDPFRA